MTLVAKERLDISRSVLLGCLNGDVGSVESNFGKQISECLPCFLRFVVVLGSNASSSICLRSTCWRSFVCRFLDKRVGLPLIKPGNLLDLLLVKVWIVELRFSYIVRNLWKNLQNIRTSSDIPDKSPETPKITDWLHF